ncbi:DNA recombination protein RmuC [Campylobacter sp.]|uniref:DNA recombination protein RmuC n=1 Tax=Campylobacter sp. TaxID=205 RepID=UPI0026DC2655|nr:DNA recombination protein RmuC [Campylobacter sp.]MDO4674362.1 DNA recombination protein RmuC [Campylobacter sp.]
MIELILIVLAGVILPLLFYLYARQNRKFQQGLQQDLRQLSEEKIRALSQVEFLQKMLEEKAARIEELGRVCEDEKQRMRGDYERNLRHLEERMERNLQKQNLNFLHQNKLMLGEDIKKLLNDVFTPVKQSVKEYSQRLLENELGLKNTVKNIFEFSQNLSADADKLAKILRGDKKIRGNFAELQLKSVLESSGLIPESQYKLQAHFKDEDKSYKPDAVVFLDPQKSIIIDAKFSLPSSFDFEDLSEGVCRDLAFNLKARIDELSKKPYAKFDHHSYDFVLLFIPYQNILDLALSVDAGLYRYAYEKKIYLTTPHTLFMALNTINISWRQIKSGENVLKAFDELGKFHDKFAGFLEDFERLKNASKNLSASIETMQNKLQSGTGNLSSRIAKLKELGAKTQKSLPKGGEG